MLDGVYSGPTYHPGPYLPLSPAETEDVVRVMAGAARRVMRLLESGGAKVEGDASVLGKPAGVLNTFDPQFAMVPLEPGNRR